LYPAPRDRLGEAPRKFFVNEVFVVTKIHIVCRQFLDLFGDPIGRARTVLTSAKMGHDAEGAFHAAAPRGSDKADRREYAFPGLHFFRDPDRAVDLRIPQISSRLRQRRRIRELRPDFFLIAVVVFASPQEPGDGGADLAVFNGADEPSEGGAALPADDSIDVFRVEVRGCDGRVVTSDDNERPGQVLSNHHRQILDDACLVGVAGEANNVRAEISQHGFERLFSVSKKAKIHDSDGVVLGNRRGKITELNRFEPLQRLEPEDGTQPRLGFDQEYLHRI